MFWQQQPISTRCPRSSKRASMVTSNGFDFDELERLESLRGGERCERKQEFAQMVTPLSSKQTYAVALECFCMFLHCPQNVMKYKHYLQAADWQLHIKVRQSFWSQQTAAGARGTKQKWKRWCRKCWRRWIWGEKMPANPSTIQPTKIHLHTIRNLLGYTIVQY